MNPWITWVAIDWLWIIAAYLVLPSFGWLGWAATAFVVATRQHALGVLGHEGAHHNAIPGNKTLNDALTNLLCLNPVCVDVAAYREHHFEHHRHTGNAFRDPELINKRLTHGNNMPDRLMKVKLIVCDLIGLGAWEAIIGLSCINMFRVSSLIVPVIWHTCAFLAFGWEFTALWFFSMLTVQWAIFRHRVWHEHQGSTETWPTVSKRLDFLFRPHNINFHKEHHDHPSIPFHELESGVTQ